MGTSLRYGFCVPVPAEITRGGPQERGSVVTLRFTPAFGRAVLGIVGRWLVARLKPCPSCLASRRVRDGLTASDQVPLVFEWLKEGLLCDHCLTFGLAPGLHHVIKVGPDFPRLSGSSVA